MRSQPVLALIVAACAAFAGACSGPSAPPPSAAIGRPTMKVVKEDRGEILSVRDVMIDPAEAQRVVASSNPSSTNLPGSRPASARRSGVLGTVLGGGPKQVPGEEITIQLNNGQLILIVQERSNPVLAKGERVRVVQEQHETGIGATITRVERMAY